MKAGSKYLLDIGTDDDWSLRGDQVIMVLAGGIGGIMLLILLATRRWVFAAVVAALVASSTFAVVFLINLSGPNWEQFPIQFSYILGLVAVLLCTRMADAEIVTPRIKMDSSFRARWRVRNDKSHT